MRQSIGGFEKAWKRWLWFYGISATVCFAAAFFTVDLFPTAAVSWLSGLLTGFFLWQLDKVRNIVDYY